MAKSKTSKEKPITFVNNPKKITTLQLTEERDIAMDFAAKVYKGFGEVIKCIILFGSSAKHEATEHSDIDIIIIIDDVSVKWDQELVAWYREELAKLIQINPYKKSLHINTVKLSTWWEDMLRGDPIVVNIIRYGDPLIDVAGFYSPLKILLQDGKIRSTPEAIYTLLQRAPNHLARTKSALLAAIDGIYWSMVDSAHAAIIAANISPPSPEHIGEILQEQFVSRRMLHPEFVKNYQDMHILAKSIIHGDKTEVSGAEIDEWITISDHFIGEMATIIDKIISTK